MNGPMYKKGGKRTNWLQRHFTLFNGALCYYASKETKTPKGFILTKDITECRPEAAGKVGKKSGKGAFCLEVVTKARTYYFAPDTAELRDQWIAAIKSWIGYSEEDVSAKELPQPGTSNRESKTAGTTTTTAEAAAATTTTTAAAPAAAAAAAEEEKKEEKNEEAAAAEEKKAEETAEKKEEAAEKAAEKKEEAEEKKEVAEEKKEEKKDEEKKEDEGEKQEDDEHHDKDDQEGELQLYVAQYDYDAQEDNELTFKEGDVITVLDTFKGAGWWKCELNNSIGLVANNFLAKK